MFHNIFEKLKLKKRRSKGKIKPKIIIDIHEKDSLVISELKSNSEIELEIRSLKIGDYLIGNIIIERKTTSDFISSMISKRLIEQLRQMQQYEKRLLIIEGQISSIFKEDTNLHPNSVRGFIFSIINNYETSIIYSLNDKDTANYLITLAKQQVKPKTPISFHSRIPKTIKEQKKYILEAFPNIGPRKAELLLKKFHNLSSVFNASEEDLKDILKNQTGNFKSLLDS